MIIQKTEYHRQIPEAHVPIGEGYTYIIYLFQRSWWLNICSLMNPRVSEVAIIEAHQKVYKGTYRVKNMGHESIKNVEYACI